MDELATMGTLKLLLLGFLHCFGHLCLLLRLLWLLGFLPLRTIEIILGVARFTTPPTMQSLLKLSFCQATCGCSNLLRLRNICHPGNHVSGLMLAERLIPHLNFAKRLCQRCLASIVENDPGCGQFRKLLVNLGQKDLDKLTLSKYTPRFY